MKSALRIALLLASSVAGGLPIGADAAEPRIIEIDPPTRRATPAPAPAPARRDSASLPRSAKTGLSPGIPQRLARAVWVGEPADRDGAPVIYVFLDPRCRYCHELWRQIRALRSHPVEFRYVMVGVITPESPALAAAILQSPDPLNALRGHEANLGTGGIRPPRQIAPETRDALRTNAELMRAIGAQATPSLVFQTRQQGVTLLVGAPSNATFASIVASAR